MTNQVAAQPSLVTRALRALWRAGLFLLFALVLMIPRARRLRRRVGLWRAIQGAAIVAGAWSGGSTNLRVWRAIWCWE